MEPSSVGKGGAGKPSSGGALQRSRSLHRYSGRFLPPPQDADDFSTPRGRFVNKVCEAGVPEISVDDLAEEFFRARAESDEESEPSYSKNRRRSSVASYLRGTESSRRRGRSVSRPPDLRVAPPKGVFETVSRRRRSLSVSRYRYSDSENDVESQNSCIKSEPKTSGSSILQHSSSHRVAKKGDFGRSTSQKHFYRSQDSYSSHSSSLTDEEARDVHSRMCGDEKTIQTIYVQEKLMATKEPLGYANGKSIQPKGSEALQTIVEIRRNYTTKLEESEKRKLELLAQLEREEERGQELCKIVKDLLPSIIPAVPERQSRSRRRSNDRTRMSKRLTEEAEKYFADFDISSFDGERSDTSSSIRDPGLSYLETETYDSSLGTKPLPTDADGVMLPWLQWETSTGPFLLNQNKPGAPISTVNNSYAAAAAIMPIQEVGAEISDDSFKGSSTATINRRHSKFNLLNHYSDGRTSASSFNMDEYLNLNQAEDLLFERLRQRQRIEYGGIILCGRQSCFIA